MKRFPTLTVESVGNNAYRLVGVMDLTTIDSFEREIPSIADGGGPVTLHLDDVTFLDSTGIRAIVTLAGWLSGGELLIRGAGGNVYRTLVIAGIDGRGGIRIDRGVD